MITDVRKESIIIESSANQEIKGIINPKNGLPTIANAGDIYVVNRSYNEFEIGDFIMRDANNKEWYHFKVGIGSYITELNGELENKLTEYIKKDIDCIKSDIEKKFNMIEDEISKTLNIQEDRFLSIENKLKDIEEWQKYR